MFRMNHSTFQEVLMYIEHEITPNEVMGGNRVISPGEGLTLTLRFLATGETLLLDPTSWIDCTNGSNMLDPTFQNVGSNMLEPFALGLRFHISFPLSEVINGFITACHNDNPEKKPPFI